MALTPESFKEFKEVIYYLNKTALTASEKFAVLRKAMKLTSRRDVQ
jgi:hypothetical protein